MTSEKGALYSLTRETGATVPLRHASYWEDMAQQELYM